MQTCSIPGDEVFRADRLLLSRLREGGRPGDAQGVSDAARGACTRRVAAGSMDDFYHLARVCLVKDERHYDRFDRAFAAYFHGICGAAGRLLAAHSRGMAAQAGRAQLTEEEKALIESLGGWDKLMETLRQRLEEQKGRHQGGSKWIGTARHLAVRRLWLQPRRRAHRPGRVAQPPRGEGVGPARVSQPRRQRSSSARATSRSRCGGCAASPAKARPRSSTWTTPSARPRAMPAGST